GLRIWAGWAASGLPVRPAERAFLSQDDSLPEGRLELSDRSRACHARPGTRSAARHILLVLNESTGEDVTCFGGIPLAEAVRRASGDRAAWLCPAHAVTPSSCTDIALPCLFTGCAPYASAATMHRLPLLFDLAKARGMTTMFYSASTLKWGNLEGFFGPEGAAIDDLATPHSTGLPFVHELGCDDYLMAERLRDRILATEGPLFIVLYTYGLHLPFQNESAGPIPDYITDRRARAAHTVTEAHCMVFEALHRTGRYDETMILSLGDHGEAFGVDGSDRSSRSSRLTKLSSTVTRPLFIVKPPAEMEPARRSCLEANLENRLVSLIDIAPTLASILEVELAPGLPRYSGFDLTREAIPEDRLHVTMTVNEWRSWPQAAVMLAQGDLRLCADYQTTLSLTCDDHGTPLPAGQHAAADVLLERAMEQPVLRAVIARVFKDKLHNRASLQMGRFEQTIPNLPRPAALPGSADLFFGTDILISDPGAGRLHYAGHHHDARGFGLSRKDRGILVYGPYIDLPVGRYAASFAFAPGARRKRLLMDVCVAGGVVLASQEIADLMSGRLATINFVIDQPAEALEVRLHSHHGFKGICQGLFITRVG
ncbi:MAG TPA: sulfatase-like hydrolase/transferase, partial [Gemmobacter sp.]|nr:sulfatase-like hydrolase/transferase [Gemmobacter sp.]